MANWTQPICDDCWDARNPDRPSPRANSGWLLVCAFCGTCTPSGIYVRVDPATVPWPTPEQD